MKYSNWVLAGVVGLLFQASAGAQIYESEDAEGVPDFSDTPTAGAQVVDLPSTNLMDAPPDEPAPPVAPQAPQASEMGHAPSAMDSEDGESGVVYYGGDDEDDVRAQRREDADRIDNGLPGPGPAVEPRHAEGDAVPARVEGGEMHHEGAVHHGAAGGRR